MPFYINHSDGTSLVTVEDGTVNATKTSITFSGKVNTEEFMNRGYKVYWSQAKDDISPNDIFRLQEGSDDDRALIAKYCVQDCALCNKLVSKLQIITNSIGMAQVCHVPLSFLFLRGQGVKIFSLVSRRCRLENHLIPVLRKPKSAEDKKNKNVWDKSIEVESNQYNWSGEPFVSKSKKINKSTKNINTTDNNKIIIDKIDSSKEEINNVPEDPVTLQETVKLIHANPEAESEARVLTPLLPNTPSKALPIPAALPAPIPDKRPDIGLPVAKAVIPPTPAPINHGESSGNIIPPAIPAIVGNSELKNPPKLKASGIPVLGLTVNDVP